MHRFVPKKHSITISPVYMIITFQAHYTWMCWTCNITFIQHRPKNGQIVIDCGAIPASPSELVLTLLDSNLHPLSHTGHYFNIVPAETQLLGHQTWDAATEDRLSAQWWVLVAHCQWPTRTGGSQYCQWISIIASYSMYRSQSLLTDLMLLKWGTNFSL